MKFERILIAYDGSEPSARGLDFGIGLALDKGAALTILHVQANLGRSSVPPELAHFEKVEHIYMTEREILRGDAERLIEEAVTKARKAGIADVAGERREGDVTQAIINAAEAAKSDLIVLGSRGLGDLQGLLLGSVSHKVLQTAPCSCIVIR